MSGDSILGLWQDSGDVLESCVRQTAAKCHVNNVCCNNGHELERLTVCMYTPNSDKHVALAKHMKSSCGKNADALLEIKNITSIMSCHSASTL